MGLWKLRHLQLFIHPAFVQYISQFWAHEFLIAYSVSNNWTKMAATGIKLLTLVVSKISGYKNIKVDLHTFTRIPAHIKLSWSS